jgi:hypothetical protein
MIPAAEQGFVCQFCQCSTIEAQIQGYRVFTTDVKGLVTGYMAHCLINVSANVSALSEARVQEIVCMGALLQGAFDKAV